MKLSIEISNSNPVEVGATVGILSIKSRNKGQLEIARGYLTLAIMPSLCPPVLVVIVKVIWIVIAFRATGSCLLVFRRNCFPC